ncbi:tetratricopeptide (TPR) repeat protein [Haloferula luteola]|uniref:Tetratricopeptide (TPR) repeat protein n=1 Tax=Haloferula luteola TaxID=595692 RepID=A0A840VF53_9BACT|nr:tetratricopeptide repeat protein [Haloferula luteola]MBB5351441.1 tetratricopeptide (TPR) repeat protein [Haloferula luteola]
MRLPRLRPALLVATLFVPPLGAEDLAQLEAYRQGMDALSGELWPVAIARFQTALEAPDLTPEDLRTLRLRLAESQVRNQQPEAALQALADPTLAEDPEALFWKAQALTGAGRFQDALEVFALIKEGSPHFKEALLTQALVERSLGDLAGAVATFDRLGRERNAPLIARLLKSETLLEAKQPQAALEALPKRSDLPANIAKRADFLRGEALIDLERPAEAETLFNQLTESPEGQSLRDFHLASIELARARLAQGATQPAADGLLAFIQLHPDSPVLDAAFSTLLRCLPEQPTPNDPILTRLREWAPSALTGSPSILGESGNASGSWPALPVASAQSVGAEALYYLAIATRQLGVADASLQARRLLIRLRQEFPQHPLVARSLLDLGRWDLEAGRKDQAAAHFALLGKRGVPSPATLRAEALALEASSRFSDGDFQQASTLFQEASTLLENEQQVAAQQNAAVSLLASGQLAAFDSLIEQVADPELTAHLALERGIYLATHRDPGARAELEAFLAQHPQHPRAAEGRLYAALAAVNAVPPDPIAAKAFLDAIPADARSSLPAATLTLVEIRRLQALSDWPAAAALAAEFLTQHPQDPARPLLLYERGRALFQNKDFNAAGIVLKTLVQESPDHPDAPAALLLAARAAAEGATPQARKESIGLFKQLAEKDSPFRDFARLELADLYILRSQLDDAIALLEPWMKELQAQDPLLVDVGLKLGEALYARAQESPQVLERALAVQDRLLSMLPEDASSRQSVLYQKGMTLEQFGDREDAALDAYMQVVQNASEAKDGDWNAIEGCGRKALLILEKREQWSAAMKLASRIASLNGPNAAEAAERAKNLRLEHMIYDR